MKAFLFALALLALVLHLGAQATTITVNVKGTPAEIGVITSIVPVVEKIINSNEFRFKIENVYNKGVNHFADTKLTNLQVYKSLVIPKWELSYEFKMQKNWLGRCPVLGWTYPTTNVVWFNTCNFKGRDAAGIAGTICHEQSHKLGHDHSSASSYNSVPYAVGNICAELYHKFK